MTTDERIEALRGLIELRESIPIAITRLRQFPWDSDRELVRLTRDDLIRVLDRYLRGELAITEVEEWAEALEGRDDVGYETQHQGAMKQIIFELANPLLTTAIDPPRVRRWKEVLVGSEPSLSSS